MKRRVLIPALAAVLSLPFLPRAAPVLGDDRDPPKESTYAWVRENVLVPKCAECHSETEGDHAALLAAVDFAGAKWVVPGAPDESVLYIRMARTEGRGRMPYKADKLPQAELDAVHDWIKNGALEN